jgi:hypothetical protein
MEEADLLLAVMESEDEHAANVERLEKRLSVSPKPPTVPTGAVVSVGHSLIELAADIRDISSVVSKNLEPTSNLRRDAAELRDSAAELNDLVGPVKRAALALTSVGVSTTVTSIGHSLTGVADDIKKISAGIYASTRNLRSTKHRESKRTKLEGYTTNCTASLTPSKKPVLPLVMSPRRHRKAPTPLNIL